MLETWEIRWFVEGAIPIKLQQWSEELGLVTQPVRSDHYLLHNGGKALGIKWREGNIQIKELVHKNAINQVEQYQKWSFKLSENILENKLKNHQKWPSITKKREMVKWLIIGDRFERIDPDEEVQKGCEVELSAVVLDDQLWWTLAYEATGGENILLQTLSRFKPPLPDKYTTMGYAEWILNKYKNEAE